MRLCPLFIIPAVSVLSAGSLSRTYFSLAARVHSGVVVSACGRRCCVVGLCTATAVAHLGRGAREPRLSEQIMSQQSRSHSGRSPGTAECLQREKKKKTTSFQINKTIWVGSVSVYLTHTLLILINDLCVFSPSLSPIQGPEKQHLLHYKPQQVVQ